MNADESITGLMNGMNKQPYMSNDSDTDRIDFASIMMYLGNLNMFSSQVLEDVICELNGELETRPVTAAEEEDRYNDEQSRDEMDAENNAIFDKENR